MDVPSRYIDLTMQRKRERWLRELQNASLHKTKHIDITHRTQFPPHN